MTVLRHPCGTQGKAHLGRLQPPPSQAAVTRLQAPRIPPDCDCACSRVRTGVTLGFGVASVREVDIYVDCMPRVTWRASRFRRAASDVGLLRRRSPTASGSRASAAGSRTNSAPSTPRTMTSRGPAADRCRAVVGRQPVWGGAAANRANGKPYATAQRAEDCATKTDTSPFSSWHEQHATNSASPTTCRRCRSAARNGTRTTCAVRSKQRAADARQGSTSTHRLSRAERMQWHGAAGSVQRAARTPSYTVLCTVQTRTCGMQHTMGERSSPVVAPGTTRRLLSAPSAGRLRRRISADAIPTPARKSLPPKARTTTGGGGAAAALATATRESVGGADGVSGVCSSHISVGVHVVGRCVATRTAVGARRSPMASPGKSSTARLRCNSLLSTWEPKPG